MPNIITSFKKYARENFGSVSKGVPVLNNECGTNVTQSNLDQMEKGTRRIPESVTRFIIPKILDCPFTAAKVLPPLRIK